MLVLATIPLFADLEPEHLYDIAVLATERVVPADYTLCREGEPGDEVYVVIAGEGEVHRGEGAGKNAVGRVKPGDCVGELAVLDQAPRSATVRAEQAMRVLVIDGTAFRTLLARNPDLSAAVTAMITRRLRETLARLPAGGEAQRVSGVG
jgi:CRP-like cAMP-binding protein